MTENRSGNQEEHKRQKMNMANTVVFFLNLSSPISGSSTTFIDKVFDDEAIDLNLFPQKW